MFMRYADDESRWQAVVRRERDAQDAFYYAVHTTGVYCRPACPARLPKRENVSFYATCEEAARAGFRACRRCRPDEASLARRHEQAVAHACLLIEQADDGARLSQLAHAVEM